jgi:diguanylate cyclase (GGDEF)-like protein
MAATANEAPLNESPRKATRYAAAVLVGGGAVGFISNHLLVDYRTSNELIAVLDLVVGLVVWLLPWDRWPARATIVLAPIGFAMIGLSRSMGTVQPASYGVVFVMVFMWVGHTQPPRTSFFLAPVAALAYVAPSLVSAGDPADVRSLPVVLPVCIIAAEIPARMLARLAAARAAEHAEATAFAEAAQTDDLTGLGNRRRGNVLLDSLRPTDALLLLDLDHFKDVNDRLGHHEGDLLLIEFGHFLASHLRDADDVARYGGEEFIIVLRRAGHGAVGTAERLLASWRERRPLASFSVGVAVHERGRSPAFTFGEADAALYEAKRAGRNRVRAHGGGADDAAAGLTL